MINSITLFLTEECADVYCFGVFNGSAQVKKMDGCDFGLEKNRMDVLKFGGITRIDDMAWKKKSDGFFWNRLELKFIIDGLVKTVHKIPDGFN